MFQEEDLREAAGIPESSHALKCERREQAIAELDAIIQWEKRKGQRLKELRETSGLTQGALANNAKVNRMTVANWERREGNATLLLMLIALRQTLDGIDDDYDAEADDLTDKECNFLKHKHFDFVLLLGEQAPGKRIIICITKPESYARKKIGVYRYSNKPFQAYYRVSVFRSSDAGIVRADNFRVREKYGKFPLKSYKVLFWLTETGYSLERWRYLVKTRLWV